MSRADSDRAARAYGQHKPDGMSTLEKIRYTMSCAVRAAREKDANGLHLAQAVLKAGLNFDNQPQIALGFLQLYKSCEIELEERRDFDAVLRILLPLQRAWLMAEPRQGISIRPAPEPEDPVKGARVEIMDSPPDWAKGRE